MAVYGKIMNCIIILETCLWKLKSLSKITPKLRTLSDGDKSLSSNLTGEFVSLLFCANKNKLCFI